MTVAWLNGRLVDPADPAITLLDEGFTVGLGVFETVRVQRGRPLCLALHLQRLAIGLQRLEIAPCDSGRLERAVHALLDAAGVDEARLRITVSAGPPGGAPTVAVTVADLPSFAAAATVVTAPWPRNERGPLATVKTTAYAENLMARRYARSSGADEALLANTRGHLCEGSSTNVFVVLDGELLTPPLSAGCLPGIVRGIVVERCDVAEADVPIQALGDVQEMFLTSSLRHVQPVRSVDGNPLAPGPIARAAAAEVARFTGRLR